MTRRNSARVAGFAFLFYIAVGITTMVIGNGLPDADGTAERLAMMEAHSGTIRLNMMLGFVTALTALTLGVALWAITRDEDREIAMLALLCRVGEGLSIMVPMLSTLGLLWLAGGGAAADGGEGALVVAGLLLKLRGFNVSVAATFFAVGSTLFCWLLLRGRLIPVALAWLGVAASVLLVGALSLQLLSPTASGMSMIVWAPMGVFEIVLGIWLIVRGVGPASIVVLSAAKDLRGGGRAEPEGSVERLSS